MSAVSRKNQVTIPADVMRAAGIEPGDDVRIMSLGPGRIEMIKSDELIDRYAGTFDKTVYPDGYLEEVRGGWA